MKGYILEDVKKKIVEALKNEEAGLSGIELAKRTGINRVTLIKYLKMLEVIGLVKHKSFGASNVWYLDKAIGDASNIRDILDLRKYYMDALLTFKDVKSMLVNVIHSKMDPINLIIEVIIPSINTVYELYNRGNITASEVMIMNNIALESITLIKFNATRNSIKQASSILISTSLDSNIVSSKILETILYIKGWNTYFIGSLKPDPLFDIDLTRFLNKIWKEDEMLLICSHADKIESIQGIKEIVEGMRSKTHGMLYMLVYGFSIEDSSIFDYYTDDISKAIEWAEMNYKRFKS